MANLQQQDVPDWYRVVKNARQENNGGTVAQVYIYDRIGGNFWGEGTTAQSFIDQLQEIDDDTIELHLNSPGGAAFDGIAMKNALRQHDAYVHVIVDALAASAASIVAMAGDKVSMEESSQMMIHNASGIVLGNANEMRTFADDLDKMDQNIAEVYHNVAGGSIDDWKQAMSDETWYTGAEAVAAGLADETIKPQKKKDSKQAKNNWDLSIYAHAGRQDAPAPRIFNTSKEPGVTAPNNTQPAPVQPPTPAAPPVLPQPVVPQSVAAQSVAFTLSGKATTDAAEVQAHITQLESNNRVLATFKKEQLETGRKTFVEELAKGDHPKIVATQVDPLTQLALSLSDEQFANFKASYDSAVPVSLVAGHGVQDTGAPTDPANTDVQKVNDELAIAKAIVNTHRLQNMSEENLAKTKSYQDMVRLEAAAAAKK